MELDRQQLVALVLELRAENARLRKRIEELEARSSTTRLEESYSLQAEEQRRGGPSQRRRRQKSPRRGRRPTQDKLDRAERRVIVLPEGRAADECELHRQRPVWRIEAGRAVLVGYEIYRGPNGELPTVSGLLPRSEYGLEIHVTLAYLVFLVGLSMDKVVALLNFFWHLTISKSQVDALLNTLTREWEGEFETLCQLLAVSAVVHADETSWSIHSVWAFLSEKVRLLVFGCRKDAATLELFLPRQTFDGILISDDAAVYRHFSTSQKCWAHLLRKAIRLTLLAPESLEYRAFLDGLLEVYRTACRHSKDQRLSAAGRQKKVDTLSDRMCELCGDRFTNPRRPTTEAGQDHLLLVQELVRLLADGELFTFVRHPVASGTNNESERTLRGPAQDRRTGRTSKTLKGARRRTILSSILESLRLHVEDFTLAGVLNEVTRWPTETSPFARLLKPFGLSPPHASPLNTLWLPATT
ncbi:MAG: transposase [Bdellovibrionales bacterium]|nr:transposase [Bdellovibrionales bacterium]